LATCSGGRPIGVVVEVRPGHIYIAASDRDVYIGDLVCIETRGGLTLAVVEGYTGKAEVHPAALEEALGWHRAVLREAAYMATPLLTLTHSGSAAFPYPPAAGSIAYTAGAEVLSAAGARLSSGRRQVEIAWLRSGSASDAELSKRFYHRGAAIRADLEEMASKHVLVVGHTGSGKTSTVMYWLAKYAAAPGGTASFIVFDRHGEYSGQEFRRVLLGAASADPTAASTEPVVRIYELGARDYSSRREGPASVEAGRVAASSIAASDFLNALDDPEASADLLLAAARVVSNLAYAAECAPGQSEDCVHESVSNLVGSEEPTLNALLLLVLVQRNILEEERRDRKLDQQENATFYASTIRSEGVYVAHIRRLAAHIRAALNISVRPVGPSGREVYVIDDRHSPVEVPDFLKDPHRLSQVLTAIYKAAMGDSIGNWSIRYSDGYIEFVNMLSARAAPRRIRARWLSSAPPFQASEAGIDVREMAQARGKATIIALNDVPDRFADMIASAVARSVLEERISLGAQAAAGTPPVVLVSEEAPLYLGPDKVRSPLNPFARVAREGRKFRVGLVAVTQLATRIERNILDNFNTIVALRTTSRSDLSWLEELSFPAHTIPRLGLREGYILSTELSLRAPIPVYIPAYYSPDELYGAPGGAQQRPGDAPQQQRKRNPLRPLGSGASGPPT